jgi:hypothetical protein
MWSSGGAPEREKEVKLRVVRTAEMTARTEMVRDLMRKEGKRRRTRIVRRVDVEALVEREVLGRVPSRIRCRVELAQRLLERPRDPFLHPALTDGGRRGLTVRVDVPEHDVVKGVETLPFLLCATRKGKKGREMRNQYGAGVKTSERRSARKGKGARETEGREG